MRKFSIILAVFASFLLATPSLEEYDKNCTSGDKFACLDIGMVLFHAGKENESKPYLNKACQNSLIAGCDLYAHALTLEGNVTEAEAYFSNTCDQNSSYGCLNMGILKMKNDPKIAKEFLIKSCKLKDTRACQMLSMF